VDHERSARNVLRSRVTTLLRVTQDPTWRKNSDDNF
jgi:hypothetical protein